MRFPATMIFVLLFPSLFGNAFAAGKAVEVIVEAVSRQTIDSRIEALGTLKANESIQVTSNITKKITKINFDDGQRINKGDVLVELASTEEQALLNEARFNSDDAHKQYLRVKSMLASNAASQSLLDQRLSEYEAFRARYLAIESRLDELKLSAPFRGVVGLRHVSVGALVTPGDIITTLIDDSKMKLDFSVPAIHLRSLRIGLPITAKSGALGGKSFTGVISGIDNQIDPVTRSIKVRALLPNEQLDLKSGMLMRVDLYADQREVLVISESALVPLGSNNFVFVIQNENSTTLAERRPVTIGQRLHGEVEILSGLNENEQIITHGVQKIRAGQEVMIQLEVKAQ